MTQHNKTRYNYGGNGRNGSNNKGKKYINYYEEYIPTPEDMQRCTDFKNWFSNNYNTIKEFLINKGKYDDDIMTVTFLKIYRYLEYGGIVDNYKYYWNTSYFTNIFKHEITQSKYNSKHEYMNYEDFDELKKDEADEQYLKKDALIEEIADWLNNNVNNLIHRELFIIYVNTKYDGKYKMTYKKLSEITGVPLSEIIKVIPLIKKQLQEELKIKRLQTL